MDGWSNDDDEEIQRALREISLIRDGAIVKTLKGVLERQARILARISEVAKRLQETQPRRADR